jgi:hypothetical protein
LSYKPQGLILTVFSTARQVIKDQLFKSRRGMDFEIWGTFFSIPPLHMEVLNNTCTWRFSIIPAHGGSQ